MLRSLTALLTNLVDYAGLYPPAKLGMSAAVDNYATYLRSEESWMLGRFICPVSRLEEFRREARGLLPIVEPAPDATDDLLPAQTPWRLSAIIDGDLEENLDAIFAFNHEHQQPRNGLANIDAIEVKAATPSAIDTALDSIPEEVYPFFEIPFAGAGVDVRGFVAALSGTDAAAKIRTGGLTPDAFPAAEPLAAFLVAAASADVPFKATAGLHHPIRAEHPLTYEPNCPRGVMHGFVNLFLAGCFARSLRPSAEQLAQLIADQTPQNFRFSDAGVEWRGVRLSTDQITEGREVFATSFGSCSFDEPVEDLRALKWL